MNNDLEQFSEERLMKLSEKKAALSFGEVKALARIALAAKQAKTAYWIAYYPNPDPNEFDDREHSHSGAKSCAARIAAEIGGFIVPVYHGTQQPAHTEQDGWIKCSERMPDEEGMYQCWGKFFANDEYGYFCSSYRPHIKPMWVPVEDDCDPIDVSVTHWMPLPAAPKPESE